MSQIHLLNKAHEEFMEEILKLLKKWKFVKNIDNVNDLNIYCGLTGSEIDIFKTYESKEDISF